MSLFQKFKRLPHESCEDRGVPVNLDRPQLPTPALSQPGSAFDRPQIRHVHVFRQQLCQLLHLHLDRREVQEVCLSLLKGDFNRGGQSLLGDFGFKLSYK